MTSEIAPLPDSLLSQSTRRREKGGGAEENPARASRSISIFEKEKKKKKGRLACVAQDLRRPSTCRLRTRKGEREEKGGRRRKHSNISRSNAEEGEEKKEKKGKMPATTIATCSCCPRGKGREGKTELKRGACCRRSNCVALVEPRPVREEEKRKEEKKRGQGHRLADIGHTARSVLSSIDQREKKKRETKDRTPTFCRSRAIHDRKRGGEAAMSERHRNELSFRPRAKKGGKKERSVRCASIMTTASARRGEKRGKGKGAAPGSICGAPEEKKRGV